MLKDALTALIILLSRVTTYTALVNLMCKKLSYLRTLRPIRQSASAPDLSSVHDVSSPSRRVTSTSTLQDIASHPRLWRYVPADLWPK